MSVDRSWTVMMAAFGEGMLQTQGDPVSGAATARVGYALRGRHETSRSAASHDAGHLAAFLLAPPVAVALPRLGRSLRGRLQAVSASRRSLRRPIPCRPLAPPCRFSGHWLAWACCIALAGSTGACEGPLCPESLVGPPGTITVVLQHAFEVGAYQVHVSSSLIHGSTCAFDAGLTCGDATNWDCVADDQASTTSVTMRVYNADCQGMFHNGDGPSGTYRLMIWDWRTQQLDLTVEGPQGQLHSEQLSVVVQDDGCGPGSLLVRTHAF